MSRRAGQTYVITGELAARLYQQMVKDGYTFHSLAPHAKTDHKTITRAIGPGAHGQWRDERRVMAPVLDGIMRALGLHYTDEIQQHVSTVSKRAPRTDDDERRCLELFRRIRRADPAGGVRRALAELTRLAEKAEAYNDEAPLDEDHLGIPDFHTRK